MSWLDVYLDNLVRVETTFLAISWWIFGIVIAIAIGVISFLRKSGEDFSVSLGCGCVSLFLLFLPLFEWLTLVLAKGMAEAVGPQGITDVGKFLTYLIIYLVIGSG